MEKSTSNTQNDVVEEPWSDASDDFPFIDCATADSAEPESSKVHASGVIPPGKTLRRRRSISHVSSIGIEQLGNYPKFKDRKLEVSRSLIDNRKIIDSNSVDSSRTLNEGVIEESEELSVITNENSEEIGNLEEDDSDSRENEDSNMSILLLFVNMLIKFITFQIGFMISIVKFPVWLIYTLYMFVIDPFGIMRRVRCYVVGKVMRMCFIVGGGVWPFISERLKDCNSVLKLGLKCGWGILWTGYVGIVLVGLLFVSFIIGGLVVKVVVEEPLRIKEVLNFDYTEKSPVAYVPLAVHPMGDRLVEYMENVEEMRNFGGGRRIPPNHNLQVTVSLKLPESDYNRNLGNFQVRVDLLSADGMTLASSRQLCILRFKSDIIRLGLTFLNVAPLITGYASESQTLNLHFRGFTEGIRPTESLRVIIEQRAQSQPGGGIPEIYAASLALESELPLLKRVVWYWKKTLFVWISLTLFSVELFFTLLCCKPLLIPRIKLRELAPSRNASGVGRPVQR